MNAINWLLQTLLLLWWCLNQWWIFVWSWVGTLAFWGASATAGRRWQDRIALNLGDALVCGLKIWTTTSLLINCSFSYGIIWVNIRWKNVSDILSTTACLWFVVLLLWTWELGQICRLIMIIVVNGASQGWILLIVWDFTTWGLWLLAWLVR